MSLAGYNATVADAWTGPVALVPEPNRVGEGPEAELVWPVWVLMVPLPLRGRVSHLGTICWSDLV